MARKKAAEPVPAHLLDLIAILEGQEKPDRVAAIREVEKRHELALNLEEEMLEHPAFAERYRAWWRRLQMGLEDAAVGSALSGRGSATTILRGMGAMKGSGEKTSGGNGRLVLERDHAARVDDFRRW